MNRKFLIELEHLPEEGTSYCGELPPEIFDLPAGDAAATGPLTYDLHAQRFGSELMLRGRLAAPFQFTCVRTLHPFIRTIRLEDAVISIEITTEGPLDATDALREEILINLPVDPRCDEADDPHHCEIDPRYLSVDKSPHDTLPTSPRAASDDRWSALDGLKNLKDQP